VQVRQQLNGLLVVLATLRGALRSASLVSTAVEARFIHRVVEFL